MSLEQIKSIRFSEIEMTNAYVDKYNALDDTLSGDPRTCSRVGASRCKYIKWFRREDTQHLALTQHSFCIKNFHRFRLGASSLNCNTHSITVPRLQRHCNKCTLKMVEDEYHLCFECPAYASIKENWSTLFECTLNIGDINDKMKCFFDQKDQNSICLFINAMLKFRDTLP